MNRFPLNIIDIGPLIKKVIHYSEIIFKKFIGMFHDMKYFIKRFVLVMVSHLHIFIIVCFSLLGITLLLSKNKLGNILILCYLILILFMFGFVSGIVALLLICIEKLIKLIKVLIKLAKMEKKISIKFFINLIKILCAILLFTIELFVIAAVLTFLAIVVDILLGLTINIFEAINGLYSATSLVAQTATSAIDSFGTIVRKGFEKCD